MALFVFMFMLLAMPYVNRWLPRYDCRWLHINRPGLFFNTLAMDSTRGKPVFNAWYCIYQGKDLYIWRNED